MPDPITMLAQHMAEQAAINAAWRWFRTSKKPVISLSEVVARVHRRCPDVPAEQIRREIERRLSRT